MMIIGSTHPTRAARGWSGASGGGPREPLPMRQLRRPVGVRAGGDERAARASSRQQQQQQQRTLEAARPKLGRARALKVVKGVGSALPAQVLERRNDLLARDAADSLQEI